MRYKEHVGKMYDVISYGIIYFCKQTFMKKYESLGLSIDDAFVYFDEVKNNCKPLPECLYPFYFYDSYRRCFLSDYFFNFINPYKHKYKDLLNILQDFSKLKKCFFDYVLENISENDRIKIVEGNDNYAIQDFLKSTSWTEDMKRHIIYLLYNFDFVAERLIENVNEINKQIQALHLRYRDKINLVIEESNSKEVLNLLKKVYSLNEKEASKQFISLCLMNQYVKSIECVEHDEAFFILGCRYKEALEVECNNKIISLQTVFEAIGDPIRFKTIDCFRKYGKLTQSDISRLTITSVPTAFNNVNKLLEERIIKLSFINGRKVYYSLNDEFIPVFREALINYIDYLENKKE